MWSAAPVAPCALVRVAALTSSSRGQRSPLEMGYSPVSQVGPHTVTGKKREKCALLSRIILLYILRKMKDFHIVSLVNPSYYSFIDFYTVTRGIQ